MSVLGMTLPLPEGSRLTGVETSPLLELLPEDGALVLNFVTLPPSVDSEDASSALAPYLDFRVAGFHGNSPDGSTWCAALQYAPTGADVQTAKVATAAFHRALELLGISVEGVFIDLLTDMTICEALTTDTSLSKDDLEEWSLSELTLALLVELSGTSAEDLITAGDVQPEQRSGVLTNLLHEWASIYSGPEPV